MWLSRRTKRRTCRAAVMGQSFYCPFFGCWISHLRMLSNSMGECGEMSVFSQGWHAQIKKCLHGIIRRPAWPLLKDDMHKTFVLTFILAQENLAAVRWRLTWFRNIIYLTYLINKKGRVIHNASNQLPPKNVEFLFNFLKHASYTTGRPVGVSAEQSMIGCWHSHNSYNLHSRLPARSTIPRWQRPAAGNNFRAMYHFWVNTMGDW